MNAPIRKIGMQGREAVYLLNGEQTTLYRGLNHTQVYLGPGKNQFGEITHHFAPNRRQRRQVLQTRANRAWHGKHVNRWQVAPQIKFRGRSITRKEFYELDGLEQLSCTVTTKRIPHFE